MKGFSELIDHLFRHEAGRMTGVLSRVLGLANLDLAEDIVQDVICQALQTWPYRGIPENPAAWLMTAARNRAIDLIRKERTKRRFAEEVVPLLESEARLASFVASQFTEPGEIRDGMIRMMFSCVDPELALESQVALILKTLCGFSVFETSQALFSTEKAMEQRLLRARAALRSAGKLYELEGGIEEPRLPAILKALYLLFSEGYHGAHPERTIREELCAEAIRLVLLLTEGKGPVNPDIRALLALMYLLVARLPARLDAEGVPIQLEYQDRSLWNRPMIEAGLAELAAAATGERLSEYHLEAQIALQHAMAPSLAETDWAAIIQAYDLLFQLNPSPVIAMNRAIAIGQFKGPAAGIAALSELEGSERLAKYPFYWAALGEFSLRQGHGREARAFFERAVRCARSPAETTFLRRRVAACEGASR